MCWLRMTSLADSSATFEARAKALQIPTQIIETLAAQDANTMAKYAWVSGLPPGTKEADDEFVAFLHNLLDPQPTVGVLSSLRRLWFESHTLWLADMKQQVERPADATPRKVPQPERGAQQADQRKRLLGVDISGSMEPSNALIDLIAQMREENILRYVEPSVCTSRQQELQLVKKDSYMRVSNTGQLIAVAGESDQKTDTSTDLKVRLALTRRALAFDQFGIISYAFLEKWHTYLFDLAQRPSPAGYSQISLQQVLDADRQVFVVAAQNLPGGIAPKDDGSRPTEEAIEQAKADPIVVTLLRPLLAKVGASKRDAPAATGEAPAKQARQTTTVTSNRRPPRRRFTVPLPAPLRGLATRNKDGVNICFNYNLQAGCSKASPGQKR